MREGGTCDSGLAGSEAEEVVWLCLVISVDRQFSFVLFSIHSIRRCLLPAQPSIFGVSR